jgi:hypothetical protein
VVTGDGLTVVGNLVSEIDGQDGMRVEPEATGTLLKANISNHNGDPAQCVGAACF